MAGTPPVIVSERARPHNSLHHWLRSIEQVMGPDGKKAVLDRAGLPPDLDNASIDLLDPESAFGQAGLLEQAVEEYYGPRGARAVLLRIGGAAFRLALQDQPRARGLAGRALRTLPFLPLNRRVKLLFQQMVAWANESLDLPSALEQDSEGFTVVVESCPCQHRPAHAEPCCHMTLGLFAEGLRWLTDAPFDGGEITCINTGADACRFRFSKRSNE